MKTKRSTKSTNKLVRLLNKKTIAHLNHREMLKVIRGGWEIDQDNNLVQDTDDPDPQPTPVTTDSGITPFRFCRYT
ncbi:MAG: hypothetical protein GTN53_25075 [Candidatus Aminicenantes bacterium]|nr:hypothetical protein [Candidatus Aminicenantes bacterium]NIQ69762.1 hypothetical protein [Candidatus Aminicenantes bacterium]NIT25782.1 hypothetical protein [Candidatus Aminicenantes bacterium]